MDDTNIGTDRMSITMPANILAQIDAQVGSSFVDREEFMRAAARHYLEFLQAASGPGPEMM